MIFLVMAAVAGEGWSPDQIQSGAPPAFVFLGVEAPTVEHPATPGDFAASVGDSFSNGSYFPANLAIEAAPFWWSPNGVSIAEYVQGGGWTWWRNIQISAGSDTSDEDVWSGALAVRTTAWLPPKNRGAEDGITAFVEDYQALTHLSGELPPLKTECGQELGKLVDEVRQLKPVGSDEEVQKRVASLGEICNQSLDPRQYPLTAAACNKVDSWNFNPAAQVLPTTKDVELSVIAESRYKAWNLSVQKQVQREVDAEALAASQLAVRQICNQSLDAAVFPKTADLCEKVSPGWKTDPTVAPPATNPATDAGMSEELQHRADVLKSQGETKESAQADAAAAVANPGRVPACAALLKQLHDGWYLEIAAGSAARSPDQTFNNLALRGFGGWLNLTRVMAEKWSISGSARLLSHDWDQTEKTLDASLMVGGIFTGPRYNLSLSASGNYGLIGGKNSVSGTLGLDYLVQPGAWVSGSFGADYPIGEKVQILSGLSVNFSVGKNRPDGL